jgi:simple sugar transport system permease protein
MSQFAAVFNTDLLSAMVRLSTPITLAAIGATVCERSGIVNIAMEGIMIIGSFFAAVTALLTGNPWLGLVAGVAAGGVFSLIHAVATISLHLDHTVSGAVLNILAFGITRYLMVMFFGHPGTTDAIPKSLYAYQWAVPGLSRIPVLGPILFNQTPIVYFSFVIVIFFSSHEADEDGAPQSGRGRTPPGPGDHRRERVPDQVPGRPHLRPHIRARRRLPLHKRTTSPSPRG